jgi:hypothetical protein
MSVLKSNLKRLGNESVYSQLGLNQADFELLWTTFFDLYDTLESFGSHLTKVSVGLTLTLIGSLGAIGIVLCLYPQALPCVVIFPPAAGLPKLDDGPVQAGAKPHEPKAEEVCAQVHSQTEVHDGLHERVCV